MKNLTLLLFIYGLVCAPVFGATFDVNTLADGNGVGSLRWAINQVNQSAGPHTITFSVSGTINLTQALPTISRSVHIDGTSAPIYVTGMPAIEVVGNGTSSVFSFIGGSDDSQISGLAIGNGVNGIEVSHVNRFTLTESNIGMAADGNTPRANTNDGIRIVGGAGHVLNNNVLSANGQFGARINDATDVVITGNLVGTNRTGTQARGNGLAGIQLANVDGAQVGGTNPTDRNVISGNGTNPNFNGEGLRLQEADNVTIEGNVFGGDITATQAIPNRTDGIYATGVDGTNTNRGADNHLIGGSEAGRNYFIANGRHGLFYEYNTNDITITHNFVGVGADGALDESLGNGENGISIENGATNVTIGGSQDEGNVISNNGRLYLNTDEGGQCRPNGSGVKINGGANLQGTAQQIENAVVQGNIIGLDPTGTIPVGNEENGFTATQANGVVVGGLTPELANTISANGNDGRTPCGGDPTDDKIKRMNIGQAVVINFSDDAQVIGNLLGTNIDGEGGTEYGNYQSGVIVIFSDDVIVGSDATPTGGNIIANNQELGIQFVGGNDGLVYNNKIGVTATGVAAGNFNGGILIEGVLPAASMGGIAGEGQGYVIGGAGANQSNVIANSVGGGSMGLEGDIERFGNGYGIGIRTGDPSVGNNNTIGLNEISCNAGVAVALNFEPTTEQLNAFQEWSDYQSRNYYDANNGFSNQGNSGRATPKIDPVLSTTTFTRGTTDASDTHVDIYYNPSYAEGTSCDCEAEVLLGSAPVNGGEFEFAHLAVADSAAISVIARNGQGNSSQASVCCRVSAGTIDGPTQACEGDEIVVSLIEALGNNLDLEMSTDGGNSWAPAATVQNASFATDTGYMAVTMGIQPIQLRVYAYTDRDIPCDDYSNVITVNPIDPFEYIVTPPQDFCEGASSELTIELDGVYPFIVEYNINGVFQSDDITEGDFQIEFTTTSTFELLAIQDAACAREEIDQTYEVEALPCGCTLTAQLTGGMQMCEGETATVDVEIHGSSAPYTLEFTLNGVEETLTTNDTVLVWEYDAATTVELIGISTPTCDEGIASGEAIITTENCCSASAELTGEVEICPGGLGAIQLTLTGSPPFSVVITGDSAEFPMNNVNQTNIEVWVNKAGNYWISSFQDGANCQNTTISGGALVTYFLPPSIGVETVDPTCPGACDGQITLTGDVDPGQAYTWSGPQGELTIPAGEFTSGNTLCEGDYSISGLSQYGCPLAFNATITDPQPVTVSTVPDLFICPNFDTTITLTVAGGTEPYNFDWSDGGDTNPYLLDETLIGRITVTVSDANGCSTSTNFSVDRVGPMTVQAIPRDSVCPGGEATAEVVVSGGRLPYNYQWSTGGDAPTETVQDIQADQLIQVTVTDGCGQFVTAQKPVGVYEEYSFKPATSMVPSCEQHSYQLFLEPVPNGNFNCTWSSNGEHIEGDCNGALYDVLGAGSYNEAIEVTFTGSHCPTPNAALTLQSSIPAGPNPSMEISQTASGEFTTFYIENTTTDPVVDYTWELQGNALETSWSQTIVTHELDAGDYEICLEVTDSLGCIAQVCDGFYVEPILRVWIANAFTPTVLDGKNDDFKPVFYGIPEDYQFAIFDRWGDMLFITEDFEKGWDGYYKNVMSKADVYTWKLMCGHPSLGNREISRTGKVTLVR